MGVHACGHALNLMGVPSDSINVYDLDDGYMAALYNHLKESGMEVIKLNLGKSLGDLLEGFAGVGVALRHLSRRATLPTLGRTGQPQWNE